MNTAINTTKSYAKIAVAKMQAGKISKKTGIKHIVCATEDGFQVATEAEYAAYAAAKLAQALKDTAPVAKTPRAKKSNAPEGGIFGSRIPLGKASFSEQVQSVWVFAELANDDNLKEFLAAQGDEGLNTLFGKSKTRWGAIFNVRAAQAAA